MATDPTTMTPVEIDTVLAENYKQQGKLDGQIHSALRMIDQAKRSRYSTLAEVDGYTVRLEALQAQRLDLIRAAAPYQLEYSRRPWNRYFLVDNTNGHVHRHGLHHLLPHHPVRVAGQPG